MERAPGADGPLAGGWLWLFPASQAIHTGEEALGGYRFHHWMARLSGAEVSEGGLLALHALFVAGMAAAALLATRGPRWGWVVPALAALVLANAAAHVAGSLYTTSYLSGLLSAALVWIPLGSQALIRARARLPHAQFWGGVVGGLLIQGPVSWAALGIRPL